MPDDGYMCAPAEAQLDLRIVPTKYTQPWPVPSVGIYGRDRWGSKAEILAYVSHRTGISPAEIIGPRRLGPIAWARHEFVWRCRQVKRQDGSHRHSYPSIGRFTGGRDHTTAVNSFQRYEAFVQESGQ